MQGLNRWPASAGSAASSLPPCLPACAELLPALGLCPALRAAGSSHGGAGVGSPCGQGQRRGLGGLCTGPPARPIMPLLDFFWACFKRAKVRNGLFKWCPSFDTLLILGEAAGRDGGGGVSSGAGVCAQCLTPAPEGCRARTPHARERLILDGPHVDALVSVPCCHPLPLSDGTRGAGRQGAVPG